MIWQFIDSSSVGGAERHIETLARGLSGRGLAVRIVLLADHGRNPWQDQLTRAGLPVTHLDGRLRVLARALRSEHPQLLHTHGYKAGILGRVAARAAGIPVVSTFHSGARGPFPVGVYETLDDWSSGLGQRIAVSAQIQARLPFASTVIPSYVRTASTPSSAPLPQLAAFVGRLSAEKGPEAFCQLAEVANRQPHLHGVEWHVWGDGPLRTHLEARYGRLVKFHGVATDMDSVWPQVGLLVMPSLFEGVPLAALEAAAHGVPILASRVGGLPSVIVEGQTGWLFAPGDLDGALDGLNHWHLARGDGDAPSLRAACWSKARGEFSEDRWLPHILTVYRAAGLR